MKKTGIVLGFVAAAFLAGCAGETRQLHMTDTAAPGGERTIEFPKGTTFGGASKEQAGELAQIFVDSHNMAMKEMEEIKGDGKKSLANEEELKDTTKKTLDASMKNMETAQATLQKLEDMSRRQGTGEISLFFPVGKSTISPMEHERLVRFLDTLSHESRGRKIIFVSIGSASAFGPIALNNQLAQERAEAPQKVIDKYLVNVSHEYYRVYGIGDVYSPKGVTREEHKRYQFTRIIAVYETDQLPSLPEGEGAAR